MTTFNASDKSATISLSNGNLTATTSTAVSQSVRSTTSHSSGKIYFEVTFGTVTTNITAGIANAAFPLNNPGQIGSSDNDSVGFYCVSPAQAVYYNNFQECTGTTASSNGEVVSFAIDFTNQLIWVSDAVMIAAGQSWNDSATANPGNTTDGIISFSGIAAGPYFVIFNSKDSGSVATVNFGATAFNRTVPSGFTAWDVTVSATASPHISLSSSATATQKNNAGISDTLHLSMASSTTMVNAINGAATLPIAPLVFGFANQISTVIAAITLRSAINVAQTNVTNGAGNLALSAHALAMILTNNANAAVTLPLSLNAAGTMSQTGTGHGTLPLSAFVLSDAAVIAIPSFAFSNSSTISSKLDMSVSGSLLVSLSIAMGFPPAAPAPVPTPVPVPANKIAPQSRVIFTPSAVPKYTVIASNPPRVLKPIPQSIAPDVAFPEMIVSALACPIGIAFDPQFRYYIERDRCILTVAKPIGARSSLTVPNALQVLGLTVRDGFVYISQRNSNGCALLKYTVTTSGLDTGQVLVRWKAGSANGGAMAWGPDGLLYLGTGIGDRDYDAQDLVSLNGKILRLTADGRIPPGNPFGASAIFAFGLRDVTGLTFQGNRLWASDAGLIGNDKILLIKPGANYGHPLTSGYHTVTDSYQIKTSVPTLCSGPDDTWDIHGLVYANGALYFGCLGGNTTAYGSPTLAKTIITGANVGPKLHVFNGRVRALTQGPDGCIYFATSELDGVGSGTLDLIYRLGTQS